MLVGCKRKKTHTTHLLALSGRRRLKLTAASRLTDLTSRLDLTAPLVSLCQSLYATCMCAAPHAEHGLRSSGLLNHFLQLAVLVHFDEQVAAANKLSLNVALCDGIMSTSEW